MSRRKLEEFEKLVAIKRAEEEKARLMRVEKEKQRALRRQILDALPASVKAAIPRRPPGKTPLGGVTKKEVEGFKRQASAYLKNAEGISALRERVKHNTLVILEIDGVLGTEPWRVARGHNGMLVAANARLRYLENAARILQDLQSGDGSGPKMLEGVIEEAEYTGGKSGKQEG